MRRERVIALYREAIKELEEDYERVKTDTGRTTIIEEIKTYKMQLDDMLMESED